jgi:hypothetical protein
MKTKNLSVCFGLALLVCGGSAQAIVIDKYFTVNPIRVCDNDANNCTTANTFTSETEKIYAQTGVAAVFLPTTQINNTSMLSVPSVTAVNVAGNGQSVDTSTINMWFVQNMPTAAGTLYGEAYVGGNGVAINSGAVNSFNNGIGRMDTIAHELGHNFGLGHSDFGAGGANNLMTAGSNRSIPGGLGDITPDGANLSQLTSDQQTELRGSPFMKDASRVIVDIKGSTPFDSDDFFNIRFGNAPSGVFLESLQIDLNPVNAFLDPTSSPPGIGPSPFMTSNLAGLDPSEISVLGNTDGSQVLTLEFADNAFMVGDSFSFGTDIDLFSAIDSFGATPEELAGSLFTFRFSDGFGSTAAMSGTTFLADSTDVVNLASLTFDPSLLATPVGFQPPVGHLGPIDPVVIIPEPEIYAMLLAGLGLVSVVVRRRKTFAK